MYKLINGKKVYETSEVDATTSRIEGVAQLAEGLAREASDTANAISDTANKALEDATFAKGLAVSHDEAITEITQVATQSLDKALEAKAIAEATDTKATAAVATANEALAEATNHVLYTNTLPTTDIKNRIYAVKHSYNITNDISARSDDILGSYFHLVSTGKYVIDDVYTLQYNDGDEWCDIGSIFLSDETLNCYLSKDFSSLYAWTLSLDTTYNFRLITVMNHWDYYAGNAAEQTLTKLANAQQVEDLFLRKTLAGTPGGLATLDSDGKILITQLPTNTTIFRGNWDASTGVYPASTGITPGDWYLVSVAGTIDGVTYKINDRIMWSGTAWVKQGATGEVVSVNGRSNVVTGLMEATNPRGTGSFSMNRSNIGTVGNYSVAEGYSTTASGQSAHAEGSNTSASGQSAHAEGGYGTKVVLGNVMGRYSTASGEAAHAEGAGAMAGGTASHAEGYASTASGHSSHAEGRWTTAIADCSHAEGEGTYANGECQHVAGKYNRSNQTSARITGWGTESSSKNIEQLEKDGTLRLAGNVYVGCTGDFTDGTLIDPTMVSKAAASADAAATSAQAAAESAAAANTSASTAASSAYNANVYKSSAASSAGAAATSATNAATSATNAATSATNANTYKTNAATSASNAATSATNAANAVKTALGNIKRVYWNNTAGANAKTQATVYNDLLATLSSDQKTLLSQGKTLRIFCLPYASYVATAANQTGICTSIDVTSTTASFCTGAIYTSTGGPVGNAALYTVMTKGTTSVPSGQNMGYFYFIPDMYIIV